LTEIEDMRDELDALPEVVEAAALVGDADRFTRLRMREVALRVLIRNEELKPLRKQVEGLEAQLRNLDEERLRVQDGPPPEVPEERSWASSSMLKRYQMQGIRRNITKVRRELAEARAALETAEKG
jgi:hypothetical protein